MLRRIKKGVLTRSGGSAAARGVGASSWRRDRLLILCYHGVSLADEHRWRRQLYFSPDELRERFARLRASGANVLAFAEALERLWAGTLPTRAVTLTFDDGGYDFYARALPILREFDLPATVYLSTYYCVNPVPIFPITASYVLWSAGARTIAMDDVTGADARFDLSDPSERERAHRHVLAHAEERDLRDVEKQRVLSRLAEAAKVDFEALLASRVLQLMRPEEVAEIAEAGIDVQLHTHRHRSPTDEAEYRSEIRENREIVERLTGREARHFCYPSGAYSADFVSWLGREGVATATTCEAALANADDHPLLLPRLVDHAGLTPGELESWIHGTASFAARRPAARALGLARPGRREAPRGTPDPAGVTEAMS